VLQTDEREPDRGANPHHDDAAAERLVPFRKARHEWQRRETRHRGHGRDHPDPGCIDADRFQPDREERQVRADEAEARAVDQRQPGRESLEAACEAMGICPEGDINSIAIRASSW